MSSMKSSSMVCIPLMPLPPLFCTLKLSGLILFIYPSFVIAMIISSLWIRSSSSISSSCIKPVLLSSLYLSSTTRISSFISASNFFSSASIPSKYSIFASSSLYSDSSLSLSKPVRALRRISTIASACASESPNLFISSSFAIFTFSLPLIIFMISSMLSRAISKPSNI